MHLYKKAQSIIEYTSVIVLVMAGLILMRPYVMRGINAYFKTTEDSIRDSLEDKLPEAPFDDFYVPECGDNTCDAAVEDIYNCCEDCSPCPDEFCCPDTEDATNCNDDCGYCGDGTCNPNSPQGDESDSSGADFCCRDCAVGGPSDCGDDFCCTINGWEPTETTATTTPDPNDVIEDCPVDCPQLDQPPPPAVCPDGECTPGEENIFNCPEDCVGYCCDGFCNSDPQSGWASYTAGISEDKDNCCGDCGWCTDGRCCGTYSPGGCYPGEYESNCFADCYVNLGCDIYEFSGCPCYCWNPGSCPSPRCQTVTRSSHIQCTSQCNARNVRPEYYTPTGQIIPDDYNCQSNWSEINTYCTPIIGSSCPSECQTNPNLPQCYWCQWTCCVDAPPPVLDCSPCSDLNPNECCGCSNCSRARNSLGVYIGCIPTPSTGYDCIGDCDCIQNCNANSDTCFIDTQCCSGLCKKTDATIPNSEHNSGNYSGVCGTGLCGNWECDPSEDCASCYLDCYECDANCYGEECSIGDGNCQTGETCLTEPACVGNGCDISEDCLSCPGPDDCDSCCSNGICAGEATVDNCPEYCIGICGDGICNTQYIGDPNDPDNPDPENYGNCPDDDPDNPGDCQSTCNDGVFNDCDPWENSSNCPEDCATECGDGYCEHSADENCLLCTDDCGVCCGDGICQDGQFGRPDYGENDSTCHLDCHCGNGYCCQGGASCKECSAGNEFCETPDNCCVDCGDENDNICCIETGEDCLNSACQAALEECFLCGDWALECDELETPQMCPFDCLGECGDEFCNTLYWDESQREDYYNCPEDCPL